MHSIGRAYVFSLSDYRLEVGWSHELPWGATIRTEWVQVK